MRDFILSEIRRLANANGGKSPGKSAFSRATGIAEHQWSGVIWARWSDAITEAGYRPNDLQQRFDSAELLLKIIEACRHYGHVPTVSEMKLYRLRDPAFPSKGAITGHFRTKADLISALSRRALQDETYRDIQAMLPPQQKSQSTPYPLSGKSSEGFVYLIKSGDHYKVGRSEELERRIKEIRIALPEAATLVHAIRTDDPAGIEAYWHRRFANRRANGEWFKLEPQDLSAFKRRKYQ